MKDSEKVNKYLNLAREQKLSWNMKLMMILTVIGALGMVPKGLRKRLEELEISGRIETIQTTALRSARIEEFRRPEKIYCHSDCNERPPVKTSEKNSQSRK